MTKNKITNNKHKNKLTKLAALGVAALVTTGFVAVAPAQADDHQSDKKAENGMPSAEKLMGKYIDALGGKDAIAKIKTRKSVGTFAMPAMGIEASIEMVNEAPGKMVMTIEVPGFGTETTGTDGETAWALSSTNGPRVLEGDEATAINEQADLKSELNWKSRYENYKTVGEGEVDGTPVFIVEMTNKKTGRTQTRKFAKDSGLLVQMEQTQATQMGEMPSVTTLSDYREVGGVMTPFKMTITAGQMEQIVTMDSVEADVEFSDDTFAPPAEVKDLMEG